MYIKLAITKKTLEKHYNKLHLKPIELSDRDSLGVRVSKKGKVTWQYRYRLSGKSQRLSLGTYPSLEIEDAREKIPELRRWLEDGKDPKQQINAKKSANLDKSKHTLIGLTNSWIESIPEDQYKEKTINNYICVLSKWVLNNPKRNKLKENWVLEKLNVPFDDITGIMWMDYFAWIRREGSDIIAGSVLKLLKTIVKWHHKNKGNITNLSLLHYVVSDVGAASQPAERCPSAEEIANMWLAIDKSKSLPQTKLSLKLIMLMGARNSTVREMKWEHLDFDKNIWTIPQPKRKLEKPRRAAFEGDTPVQRPEIHPIPDKARELLLEFSKIYGTRGFIFKGERTNQPITTHALNRFCTRMSYKLFKEKGISKIVPHDFRRSIDSILCEIDIMWDPICEKILGHKLKGTKRHYNKAEYLDQQLEAYNLYWSIIDKEMMKLTKGK